jgi:hypothetical protein
MICSVIIVDTWKALLKEFKVPKSNFESSGRHNQHDFANYCHGDINQLWLFDWLEQLGDVELTQFCDSTSVLDSGIDTSEAYMPESSDGATDASDDNHSSMPVPAIFHSTPQSRDSRSMSSVSDTSSARSDHSHNSRKNVGRSICDEMVESNLIKRKLSATVSEGWTSFAARNKECTIASLFERIEVLQSKWDSIEENKREGDMAVLTRKELDRLYAQYNSMTGSVG